ncbi:MAG: transglycosylase SLT domain-containing protein, partial [Bacteroidota bacterium]
SDDIDFRYTAEVHDRIVEYTTYGIRQTENMLGRVPVYLPIVEYHLRKNNLPESLKYLPIVESDLRPRAASKAGAVGLWQFMEGTAKELGLTINQQIDERRDPIKSTEAALRYLTTLHKKYKDWNLVFAAYNCGPGNVNKAIREAGGVRDFWAIRPYLPTQTQHYVPAIIAAGYISNYYQSHGIQPNYTDYGISAVRSVQVNNRLNLKEIAAMTGISQQLIRNLNPSYLNGIIPSSTDGNHLILPVAAMEIFNSLDYSYTPTNRIPDDSFQSVYRVQVGDSINNLARLFKCTIDDIQEWNQLVVPEVFADQQIKVYFPKETLVTHKG